MGVVVLCVAFAQHPTAGLTTALGRYPAISPTFQKPAAHITEEDSCGHDRARPYIGSTASPATLDAVAKAAGHARIRWIRPGEAVTQDYRADRLNVIVGDAGRILTMRCG